MYINWYPEWLEDKKKWTKIPCSPQRQKIDPTLSANWMTYDQAKKAATENDLCVGMAFSEADDYFFLDLDHQYKDGQWSDLARHLCSVFNGCYLEVSHSGDGLHIIGRYTRIAPHRCEVSGVGGLYHTARFCALTGTNAQGSMDHDATPQLERLINTIFPPDAESQHSEWTTEPREDARPIEDDDELIEVALKSKSASGVFGGGATFRQLWEADGEILAKVYPPKEVGQVWGYSEADAALAQQLAFFTGCNCERIADLMKRSGLYREKYLREDYLPRTITKVCARQKDVFKRTEIIEHDATQGPQAVEGFQYLAADQQIQLFKGCVYVAELNRVLTPKGKFLKREVFNSMYGGYTFALDTDRKVTTEAWKAFTNSQVVRFPKVDRTAFKPDRPFCEIYDTAGITSVNVYRDPKTPCSLGEEKPFLDHVKKLLPDQNDQEILLSYMAACVQHKGVKFQWAPLIQGVEGNGKTLMSQCLIEALGPEYAHMPKAKLLDSQFNGWLLNKLFIGVEDIYVPGGKMDLLETLKPMITGKRQEIQLKGVDQFMIDICANFIFNSNHKDAIKKTVNDRRFAIFFTAQQHVDDLRRDGMDGNYFPKLYRWLESGGYGIVHRYLATYPIPDHRNPASGCHRAPSTSSRNDAIEACWSPLERKIMECVYDGVEGFTATQVVFSAAEMHCAAINGNNPTSLSKALINLGYVHSRRHRTPMGRTSIYSKS